MNIPLRLILALPLAAGLWIAPAHAAESGMATKSTAKKPFPTHFVKPTGIDHAKVLPPPPEPGTLAGRADLEAVLQAQAWRTPEHVAWAKRIDKNDPYLFADVLGAWFSKENMPGTAAFLKLVDEDRHEVTEVSKKMFARARPWVVDPRVQPCVGKPGNDSYPSGHTASLFTKAGVLAEIFPDKREALFDFAHRAAWGRVYGGVHFPTDLVGGWKIAEAFVAELKKNADFQAGVAKCRAEAAPFAKAK
ncbi:MAG TPA: phosphatase PAP2 family protein [Opitutaceae bacterium]